MYATHTHTHTRHTYTHTFTRCIATRHPPPRPIRTPLTSAAQACLEGSTRKPLVALLEQQLIAEHVAAIVEKGFTPLMKDPRLEDLARMYNLLARVAALDKLKAAWNAWIKAAGVEIVGDAQRDKTMVRRRTYCIYNTHSHHTPHKRTYTHTHTHKTVSELSSGALCSARTFSQSGAAGGRAAGS